MRGAVLQLIGLAAQRRFVPVHAGQATGHAARIAHHAAGAAQVAQIAVTRAHAEGNVQRAESFDGRLHGRVGGLQVIRVHAFLPEGLRHRPVARLLAVQAPHGGVPEQGVGLQIELPDADASTARGQFQPCQRVFQVGAGTHTFADVLQRDQHAQVGRLALATAHHAQRAAVGKHQLGVPALARLGGPVQRRAEHGTAVRIEGRHQRFKLRFALGRHAQQGAHAVADDQLPAVGRPFQDAHGRQAPAPLQKTRGAGQGLGGDGGVHHGRPALWGVAMRSPAVTMGTRSSVGKRRRPICQPRRRCSVRRPKVTVHVTRYVNG